jgi:hypothetical protein
MVIYLCLTPNFRPFVDSSLGDADASNNSVIDIPLLKIYLRENVKKLEARLEETRESSESSRRYAFCYCISEHITEVT